MHLLSVIIQNKKGENILLAASPSLPIRTCLLHSSLIYQYILETYRRRLKIQRTLTLELNLHCVLSINKEYILYVFVRKSDLGLAFDGIRKINDFFTSNAKMFIGIPAAGRLEIVSKKFVEFMSSLEEFLYCREFTLKEYLPMNPQLQSKKKGVDFQIFNKFSHLTLDSDRKIILDTQVTSSKLQSLQIRKKSKVIESGRRLVIKTQDQLDLLEADPQKQQFLSQYKKNIVVMALCGRKKPVYLLSPDLLAQPEELPDDDQSLIQEIPSLQREKIKLKMLERLELTMQNSKVKEVLQFGQILIEGNTKESGIVNLLNSETYWNNPKSLNRRVTPSSVSFVNSTPTHLTFSTTSNYKSLPLLDYIIRRQSFTADKIPLLFVYSMEVSSSNIEFTFKYKLNEKWKWRLYDVDVSVWLNKQFMVMDCKSVPNANSLKNNKVTWKTKQIAPSSNNAKGKIILAFGSTNIQPKHIIKEIRLSMKSNCGLIQNLKAECVQDWGYTSEAEKLLLIQYKISPND